jgi:Transposase and inactivated derivatives
MECLETIDKRTGRVGYRTVKTNAATRVCLHLLKCVYIVFLCERNGMVRRLLNDNVGKKVDAIPPVEEGDRGRTALDNRWFLEAVLWIARTGGPWRALPVESGRWHTVYMRFSRWRRNGVWQRIALAMADETEIEHVLIDSTIARAHQHPAGASKKGGRKRSDVPKSGRQGPSSALR